MAEPTGHGRKHAGMPGSIVAIRVDYARRSTAFEPLDPETGAGLVKRQVNRWKLGHRLGDKPSWDGSSVVAGGRKGYPTRALMRQLSEYQGVKLEYNYRAAELPSINKSTQFVPKPNKLQVDRSIFLTPKEKAALVSTCPGTSAKLSGFEMQNYSLPGVEYEKGWNISTALPADRVTLHKQREYDDFRDINKVKSKLDVTKYVPPHVRSAETAKQMRARKIEERHAHAEATRESQQKRHLAPPPGAIGANGGPPPAVYKMSNIKEWWTSDRAEPEAADAKEETDRRADDPSV